MDRLLTCLTYFGQSLDMVGQGLDRACTWTDVGQALDRHWTKVGFPVQCLSNQPLARSTEIIKIRKEEKEIQGQLEFGQYTILLPDLAKLNVLYCRIQASRAKRERNSPSEAREPRPQHTLRGCQWCHGRTCAAVIGLIPRPRNCLQVWYKGSSIDFD